MPDSATSSTSSAGPASSGSASAAPNKVELLIKSSNQQYEDQTVQCDLQWSVRHLKTLLSQIYPSKPAVSEQKLIYSGQLLKNTLLLKDVIRIYKDVPTQNHIFHLVCSKYMQPSSEKKMPNQKPESSNATANKQVDNAGVSTPNGLRFRSNANNAAANVSSAQPQQPQQQQSNTDNNSSNNTIPQILGANLQNAGFAMSAPCTNYNPLSGSDFTAFNTPGQFQMQNTLATQQAAMYNWMQQVYSQYMDQYIRGNTNAANTGMPQVVSADSSTNAAAPPFMPMNPFLQPFPFMANSFHAGTNFTVYPPADAAAVQNSVISPQVSPVTSEAAAPASAPVVAPQVAQQPAAQAGANVGQQPPLARFRNEVNNQELDQRDWLEISLFFLRVAVLLLFVVINTSPLRFLVVVAIGLIILCYPRRLEQNNNHINRNNNAVVGIVAAEVNQIRQGVQEVQQAAAQAEQQEQTPEQPHRDESQPATTSRTSPSEDDTPESESASALSIIQTFVVSFFTSLLPDPSAAQ